MSTFASLKQKSEPANSVTSARKADQRPVKAPKADQRFRSATYHPMRLEWIAREPDARQPASVSPSAVSGRFAPTDPSPVESLRIWTKLQVSEPGDALEQEADRVADQVMRMPAAGATSDAGAPTLSKPGPMAAPTRASSNPTSAAPSASVGSALSLTSAPRQTPVATTTPKSVALGLAKPVARAPVPVAATAKPDERVQRDTLQREDETDERESDEIVQRACASCANTTDDEENVVRRSPRAPGQGQSGVVSETWSRNFRAAQARGGEPLSPHLRTFMEPRFKADFGSVRVHRDASASSLAESVQARAFTVGHDVFFKHGEFQPQMSHGQRLIAHELAHVVQQGGGMRMQEEVVQRTAGDGPATVVGTNPPLVGGLIVDDNATTLSDSQRCKTEFLAQLRVAVCDAADRVLVAARRDTRGCPYIERWLLYCGQRPASYLERVIRKFVPAASRVAGALDYIPLVAERVEQGVRQWLMTGELPGDVPLELRGDITGAGATDQVPRPVFRKTQGGNVPIRIDLAAPHVPSDPGSSLDSTVRSQMQVAFGQDFSDVRVHTDAAAGVASSRLQARAFTIGKHISFAAGEYRPGTLIGDALIAHELAHVVQQNGNITSEPTHNDAGIAADFERDADISTMSAVVLLWSRIKNGIVKIGKTAMPRMTSAPRLQRCSGHSFEEKQAAGEQLNNTLGAPYAHEAQFIGTIKALGSDASEVLMAIPVLSFADSQLITENERRSRLNQLAGSEEGLRVLAAISKALKHGDSLARQRATIIDEILTERHSGEGAQRASGDDQAKANRIDAAIKADPRFGEYRTIRSPLQFPVKVYKPGQEMSGGVYFDKTMERAAGITVGAQWFDRHGIRQYPLVYIRLGPLALTSDALIRSTLWHEFQHYQEYMRFRESKKTEETQTMEEEANVNKEAPDTGIAAPSAEVEATSVQLVGYFDQLSDDELKSVLRYLADAMGDKRTHPNVKNVAAVRVGEFVKKNARRKMRFISLIRALKLESRSTGKKGHESTRAIGLRDLSGAAK